MPLFFYSDVSSPTVTICILTVSAMVIMKAAESQHFAMTSECSPLVLFALEDPSVLMPFVSWRDC